MNEERQYGRRWDDTHVSTTLHPHITLWPDIYDASVDTHPHTPCGYDYLGPLLQLLLRLEEAPGLLHQPRHLLLEARDLGELAVIF